ncbi:hypothetical protein DRP44_03465 [candidate division TA06 bacterium]|uniref:ABC transmembrane type-1 domain-containing protein n=1 Tax=candidate division TA06 bacterium TaxID=2250710 RepID=A0A660S8R4_UNCT6|nr:MAG: hypothetical protein DRP44_03465 [candidate division TA06 bacterium]
MKIMDLYNISSFLLIAIFTSLLALFSGAIISYFRYAEYKNLLLEIFSILLLLALILFSIFVTPLYFSIAVILLAILFLSIGYLSAYKKREIK